MLLTAFGLQDFQEAGWIRFRNDCLMDMRASWKRMLFSIGAWIPREKR